MGMDALTAAAFESLTREILPKLNDYLQSVAVLPPGDREPDPEIASLATEAAELLTLTGKWFGSAVAPVTSTPAPTEAADDFPVTDELSDEDALRLLGSEGTSEIADVNISGGRSVAESLADDAELSDDEAMQMMLAAGDEPAAEKSKVDNSAGPVAAGSDELSDEDAMLLMMANDAPAAGAPAADAGGEMSDDEARRLLAEMDAPAAPAADAGSDGEMSDDEARRLLAEMDAPSAPAASAGGEMSDEEARRLLAEMDAPSAPAASAGGEMSDEEARRLLADMDAPSAPAAAKTSPAPAAPAAGMSAEDEAMALLAGLGGMDDTLETAAAPQVPSRAAPTPAAHEEEIQHDDDLQEIDEFSQNDFSSDPDMMNDFLSNSGELMETLDATVLQLEQNPKDRETIESIFRAAHTLKGAAGMFGFKSMERVMHRMENLFDNVRKGTLVPDANTIDVVFQGLDVLRKLLEAVRNGKPSGTKTVPIVRSLELAATGKYVKSAASAQAAPAAAPAAASAPAGAGGGGGGGDTKAGASAKKTAEQSTIRVDLERLDTLVNLVGELVIDRTRFVSIDDEIRQSHPQLAVSGNMSETVQLFGRHMNEIHELVMKIRMVPIGNTFTKFTRIVRDLSRQLGKDIELYLDGEDTELDKTLVEQIGDPLIHLIRNSCDHGIELPEVREAAGKRRSGKIFLSARQEGNHIIITIEDDGKGINGEIIRKKAIEKGLIPEDAVLTQRDTFNLIFEPGFSTAEQLTNVSGRGVGMDVVKKQISKLKGLIDIDSEVGRGTTITIRLPLTLAIMQSLLVESAGEAFAIPLSTVVESVRISPEEIQRVGDTEVIKRHSRILPLIYLQEVLNLQAKNDESWYSAGSRNQLQAKQTGQAKTLRRTEKLFVVIVGSTDNRYGIVVDQLLSQQEMVIKSLGPIMKDTACVAGGAVQGNGEVVLVLDIQEVMDEFRNSKRKAA
jgi:two-component system chemotaxis sensor kinase CheA